MPKLIALLIAVVSVAGCGRESQSAADKAAVDVPHVRGMQLAKGGASLQGVGLCVLVEQGSGPERGQIVVEQEPAPGTAVPRRTLITIVIDTPDDVSAAMEEIGAANEALGCTEGSGIGGVKGTGY